MNKILNYLVNNIFKIVIIYFIIQILLVIFWQVPFSSDSQYYYKLAQDCLRYHSLYPAKVHIFEDYILAPLYVNLIIAALSIHNSIITIGILNILLNALQMYLFFKLSNRLFNRRAAFTGLLLYMLYINTLGMVLTNLTEFLFGILILSSLIFFFNNTINSFFLSGLFAAASIAVRPLGWALAAALIIIMIIKTIKKEKILKELLAVVLGISIFICAYGTISKIYFGDFIFSSTNGPANLLIGANDDATGAFKSEVFEPGKIGYIPNPNEITYIEKGKFWQGKAEDWILAHPIKWLSLIPRKIFFMFILDDFTIPYLSHMQGLYLPKFAKMILQGSYSQIFKDKPYYLIIIYSFILILSYIYYFYIMLILLFSTIRAMVYRRLDSKYLPVILFILIGLSITVIVFGDARFKYPYMLLIILFASLPVSKYLAGAKLFFYRA